MLVLKPNCECCNTDLPPHSQQAYICSFECTFCANCAQQVLANSCPNCGGNFTQRPVRPEHLLQEYPASQQRVYNPELLKNTDS